MPQAIDLIPPGSSSGIVTFQVTLTNWGGLTGTGSISVEIRQQSVPQLSVEGGVYQRNPKGQPLVLNAQVSPSACVSLFTVAASWSAVCSPPNIQNAWNSAAIVTSSLTLTIPAFTLPLNTVVSPMCIFTITLTQTGFADAAGTVLLAPSTVAENVTVVFPTSTPVALIDQGSQTVAASRTLFLSGKGSRDPDIPASSQAGALLYCWSCSTPGGSPCFNWTTLVVGWNNITISKSLLAPSSVYLITLTVSRNSMQNIDPSRLPPGVCPQMSGLNASATVQINTAAAGVDPPIAIITPLNVAAVPVSSTVRLSGSVYSSAAMSATPVQFGWTITPNPPNLLSYNKTALNGLAWGSIAFVIAPGLLQGNQIYTIQLSSTYNSLSYISSTQVMIDNPPESGTFTVLPSAGQSLQTIFVFSALSWVDSNLPISISFGFFDQSTGSNVMLGSPSYSTSLSTPLPPGDVAGQLQVFAIVSDSLGSAVQVGCGTNQVCDVTVSPFSGSCTVLQKTYTARMQMLTSIGDSTGVLVYAAIVGKALKQLTTSTAPCSSSTWSATTATILQDVFDKVSAASSTSTASGTAGAISPQARDLMASSLLAALPDVSSMTPQILAQVMSMAGSLLGGVLPPLSDATVGALGKVLSIVTSAFTSQSLKTARRRTNQGAPQMAQSIFDWYTNLAAGGMQNKYPGELLGVNDTVSYTVERFALSTQNIQMSYLCMTPVSPSQCASWDPKRGATLSPALITNIQATYPNLQYLDVLVVDFTANPYAYAGNWSTVFGEIVRIQLLQGNSGVSGTSSVISFSSIPQAISLRIRINSGPPSNRNPTTGQYTAAGCSSWRDLSASGLQSSTWSRRAGLSSNSTFTFSGNPDNVPSTQAPGFITCNISTSAAESISATRSKASSIASMCICPFSQLITLTIRTN